MKKTVLFSIVIGLLVGLSPVIYGSESPFDIDDMFTDDVLIEEPALVSDQVDDDLHSQRISVTGRVGTLTQYSGYSGESLFFVGGNLPETRLQNSISSDLSVDIRLDGGVRSLLNVGLDYFPTGIDETTIVSVGGQPVPVSSKKYSEVAVNEFFVDTNYDRKVYFRSGKQVLKWGRGYFWNPTDLINVEYKDFIANEQVKQGTYGVRVHMPFGMTKNFYLFAGMDEVEQLEEISFAAKYEFLVGNTEMGLSAWYKKDYHPVFGYDFSTRIGELDVRGELGLSPADNRQMMDYDTLELVSSDDWVPRVSLGATKFFDHGDITDRISISGEFYYNQVGYEDNIFTRLAEESEETKLAYMTTVYEPYRNSKYYLALFTSVKRFGGNPNTTLNLNGIANLVDKSATLSGGLSYNMPMSDMSVDLSFSKNIGDDYTEATFHGNRYSLMLGTSLRF